MVGEMKVSDLIKMVHQYYEKEILQVRKENEELRLYKELIDQSLTDDALKQEYIYLRHRVAELEKEVKCWKEYGTPF